MVSPFAAKEGETGVPAEAKSACGSCYLGDACDPHPHWRAREMRETRGYEPFEQERERGRLGTTNPE